MSIQARGRDYYSLVTCYGKGGAANASIEMSGSSKSTINYTSASGSHDILQTDDVFQSGYVLNTGPIADGESLTFIAIDADDITMGGTTGTPGFISITYATTGKQIVVNYIKVNDRA